MSYVSRKSRTRHAMLLGALFVALFQLSFAKDPVFTAPPPGFRIGMEIELLPQALSNITGYFDYNRFQHAFGSAASSYLPSDFYDDYLRDYPDGLFELPESLRKSLTQGLQLESTVIHDSRGSRPLVNSNASELRSQPKIILPNEPVAAPRQIILPGAPATPPKPEAPSIGLTSAVVQRQGEIVVPKNVAWQTLYSRWKALDFSVKQSVVRWEHLNSLKKAELAIRLGEKQIKLKDHLPDEENSLLSKLYWTRDGDAMEFRHREEIAISDPHEFFKDVRLFAQRTGVERKILNPDDSRLKTANLHFHVSVKGRSLTREGEVFNDLALLRRVNQGVLSDLTGDGRYLYETTARSKGLVRIVANNRLEFRSHNIPLQEELEFVLKALSHDTDHSVAFIETEIRKNMTDYAVDKLAEYRQEYLPRFEKYMTSEQRLRIQPALEVKQYLERSLRETPEDFLERAPKLLVSKDRQVQIKVLRLLGKEKAWSPSIWSHVTDLMTNSDSKTKSWVAYALEGQASWPMEMWNKVPDMLISQDSEVQRGIARALYSQREWPKVVWQNFHSLFESQDISAQVYAVDALKNQMVWPEEFWTRISHMMKNSGSGVVSRIASALASQRTWPRETVEQATALLSSKDAYVREAVARALKTQNQMTPGFCVIQKLGQNLR